MNILLAPMTWNSVARCEKPTPDTRGLRRDYRSGARWIWSLRPTLSPAWLLLALAAASQCHKTLCAQAAEPGPVPLKYEEPKYLAGTIYTRGSEGGKPLFKFTRVATRSGSTLNVVRQYNDPDGKPAARECLVYEGDRLLRYQLEELQSGGKGSATLHHPLSNRVRGSIEFDYATGAVDAKRPGARSEVLEDNTVVNDMVGPFLVSHWGALVNGEKIKCRYIVVPRRETVGFTFTKESDSKWRGRDVIIVRMEPSSVIIGLLVSPLFFTIEKAPPHRVLQYIGRTTPKIHAGNGWKDLDAVTLFDWN